jgi:arylsulfatase A-like enzyme
MGHAGEWKVMLNKIMPKVVLAAALMGWSAFGTAGSKPNVLFLAIDDLKPWLGCYGNTVVKTPHIDRLAKAGAVFRNNYCQVALCGPTRMSLMTGLRPDTLQVYSMGGEIYHIDTARKRAPQLITLPEFFKQNGYTCLGFGKVLDGRNTDRGQDRQSWSDPRGVRWDWDASLYPVKPIGGGYQDPATRNILEAAHADLDQRGITEKSARLGFLSTVEGARPVCESMDLPDDAYAEGNVMTAPALRVIREHGANGKPFFLAVGYYKPHLPFVAPKKYWDLYSPSDFELEPVQSYPVDGVSVAETDYIEARGFHPVPEHGPIPEDLQRHMMHGYAACVSYVDAQIGRLLQALEKAGLADNTIICLWGDHGFHLGDKQIWGKHTNFEQATRSPLIIAAPSVPGGTVEDEVMTEFVDVYPTLCELAGLVPPPGLEGESLVGLMRQERPASNPPAVSQYLRNLGDEGLVMGWAVRTPRYRYVEWRRVSRDGLQYIWSGDVVGRELYDYQLDANESRNLVESAEYRTVLDDMVQQFDMVLPHLPDREQPDV